MTISKASSRPAWVQAIGAVPVSVSIGDVYSGLERGLVDVFMNLKNYRLISYGFVDTSW